MKILWICLFTCITLMSCKPTTTKSTTDPKIISLFNGEDLNKWRGDKRVWSVEDSCIIGKTTDAVKIEQNTFLIYESEFSNFELTLKYKIIGGNSGIQYRAKVLDEAAYVVGGYQADLEAGIQHSGILYEEKGRGIIAKRGEEVTINEEGKKTIQQFSKSEDIQAKINQDQWNQYRIVAQGNHLQHFINGTKTIDVTDNEKGKRSEKGVIALQVHTGPNMVVHFKDITVKVENQ